MFDGFSGVWVKLTGFIFVGSVVGREEGKPVVNWYCLRVLSREEISPSASLRPLESSSRP